MAEPYKTCSNCLVRDWCKRRSGEVPLPQDYNVNPECSGYVLLEQAHKLSGIPLEFREVNKRNYTFDNDNIQYRDALADTFNRVEDFVSNGANMFFYSPDVGTGKTRTACTIANEYIFKTCMNPTLFDFESPLALYVKYGRWANELRNMYQLDDEGYNLKTLRFMERMKKVPLLILDDIGSGRLTKYIRDLTYDLIDYRKENRLATIYTSNLNPATLETPDYLGDVITSRMLFKSVVYQLNGRNRRKEETYFV